MMAGSDNIIAIKESVKRLEHFVRRDSKRPAYAEYAVESGTALAFGEVKEDAVATARVFMSKDTVFPEHRHDEYECLVVYRGAIVVKIEGEEPMTLEVAQAIEIGRGIAHKVTALADSWLIATTVPADKRGFPGAL